MKAKLTRRQALKAAATGVAGVALGGGAGRRTGAQGDPVALTFAFAPDPSGGVQMLLDGFNEQHRGEIEVIWRQMPANFGEYFNQTRTELQAGSQDLDVIGIGGIWPAPLGVPGLIADLTDRLTNTDLYLPGAVAINTYDGKLYGAPWYTDAGLLYYRKDLLEQSGSTAPPKTWAELETMAQTIQASTGIPAGFVFQGAETPAGPINAIEFIYTSGGNVLDPEDPCQVVIDSPEALRGLQIERGLVDKGIAPQAVTTYGEQETEAAFLRGDAVFMRNWPGAYAAAADPTQSSLTLEQVGVAELPVAEAGIQSRAVQSGIQLAVNARSRNPDASWAFIEYMIAPEQQKAFALRAGQLPTLSGLYEDQDLLQQLPIIGLGKEALSHSQPRPVTPYIFEMSNLMAERFTTMLSGGASPEETAAALQEELQEIIDLGGC